MRSFSLLIPFPDVHFSTMLALMKIRIHLQPNANPVPACGSSDGAAESTNTTSPGI
jgi:hypothetical protein